MGELSRAQSTGVQGKFIHDSPSRQSVEKSDLGPCCCVCMFEIRETKSVKFLLMCMMLLVMQKGGKV